MKASAAMKAVVLHSGGMDSTTLVYDYVFREVELSTLSFYYGQRHAERELEMADLTATRLGLRHDVVDLSSLGKLLSGSALTDDIEVPDGHYSDESMRQTVVPNRNAIMLSVAVGVAVARGADFVGAAMHAGDHPIYPDCRPEFVRAFDAMARLATDGHAVPRFHVEAPYVNMDKSAIALLGDELGVPWEQTWSCYKGGRIHCGRCGTCVERAEAFSLAEVEDPTVYEDPNFWREQVAC